MGDIVKKDFINKNLLTYIGNKRRLLHHINTEINLIKEELENKNNIKILDGFSGSGVVSRLLKYHCHELYVNDIEKYSYMINECYLSNPNEKEIKKIRKYIDECNSLNHNYHGIITNNYCPEDDNNIMIDERVFYTNENGIIIDSILNKIESYPNKYKKYLMSPLLVRSSIHVNTSGVFRGFHKNKHTKIGCFGGTAENDLKRIKGKIQLEYPIFSDQQHTCNVHLYNEDINDLILKLPKMDIVYYDPPYNDTPYGSNYHMLNTILENKLGNNVSKVVGIPPDWKRSNYNSRKKIYSSIYDLLKNTTSTYIILSYNSDGFLSKDDLIKIFTDLNYQYKTKEIDYTVFRGCKNIQNREKDIKEYLFTIYT